MTYNTLLIGLLFLFVSCNENLNLLDVSDFNSKIKNRTDIVSAEELIKLYYHYPKEEVATNIDIISKPVKHSMIETTLIHNGLMDDSIKAVKIIMLAKKVKESWIVLSIKTNWKCYEGRGHQDWDTILCN